MIDGADVKAKVLAKQINQNKLKTEKYSYLHNAEVVQ